MHIKILGPGCKNCVLLYNLAIEAASDLGLDASFEKIEDYAEIMSYGILSTPGLVVDDVVVFSGKVPTKSHIKELLRNV